MIPGQQAVAALAVRPGDGAGLLGKLRRWGTAVVPDAVQRMTYRLLCHCAVQVDSAWCAQLARQLLADSHWAPSTKNSVHEPTGRSDVSLALTPIVARVLGAAMAAVQDGLVELLGSNATMMELSSLTVSLLIELRALRAHD